MASPPQLLQIAFAGGLDESQQNEILDASKAFPVLQNGRQDLRGGYTKRLGFAALSKSRLDGSTRSAGNRLIAHGDETITIDGTHLDTFAEAANVSVTSSRVPEVSVSTRTLAGACTELQDIVQRGNYIATAFYRDGTIYAALETTAGVSIRAPEAIYTSGAGSTSALLGTFSTYIVLLATALGGANVVAYYINTASAATITAGWQSIGNVATDRATGLSSQSLTDRIAFAYANSGGGTSRLTVKTIDISGVIESENINTNSVRPDVVAVEGSIADTLWVGWNESTSVKVKGLQANSLSTTLASTATIFSGTYQNAQNAPPHIVSGEVAGTARAAIVTSDVTMFVEFQTSMGAVTTTASPTFVAGVLMDARPFRLNGRYYGLFRPMDAIGTPSISGVSTDNGISILGDWTDATTAATAWIRPVAMAFPNLTSSIQMRTLHPIVGTTTAAYATPVLRSAEGTSVELITYDFASRKRWRSATHNRSLFLSGGILSYYDGARVAEAAFLYAPNKPTASDTGSGAGVTGPVRYVCTYEEVDADGNWAVSGVSPPSEPLTVTDNEVSVTVFSLAISARLKAVSDPRTRIALYRTTQGGEPPYYFVADKANVTSSTVSFTDSTTDSVLATHRKLYGTGNLPGTNGSGQDRRAPPFCQDILSYNGMLLVASGPNVYWSGQTIDGEHTWFSPAFVSPVDDDGDVIALSAQDGTVFAFKRRAIYATSGDAPTDAGAGGLGAWRKLAVDVGCIDPSSTVVTSLGIFFQSERGIELLTRGGSVVWVGEGIQRTLESYPIVAKAVLDSRNGLVRFSLAASENGGRIIGSGRDAIYDLTLQSWVSIDDKTGTSAHEASQDAALIKVSGAWRYAWLGTDGTIRYERSSSDMLAHYDGSTWITMAAETGGFKTTGIQGKQHFNRVLFLSRRSTDCKLSVALSYNYETSFRSARQWSNVEIDSLLSAGWPITQLKHESHDDAECQSVRIRIEDAAPTSGVPANGKGATWLALTLDITPKQGVFDVPEEAS